VSDDTWAVFYAEAAARSWDPDHHPDGSSAHYGKDGEPISFRAWAELFGQEDYKRVAETTVGSYWVSTVWLGINHNFMGDPPLIFETMVFNTVDGSLADDKYMERYSTIQQAEQGHGHIVEMVRQLDGL
jgi:hypothetical protein